MSIDTACSSSLVGLHLACTSMLRVDCPRALVAGVNLTIRAETTAVLSKAGMLAQARALRFMHKQTLICMHALLFVERNTCRIPWYRNGGCAPCTHHIRVVETWLVLAACVQRRSRGDTCAARLCPQDGRCKTLDAAADGYMRGEACVAHLMEGLTDEQFSLTAGKSMALVLGTAVNQARS